MLHTLLRRIVIGWVACCVAWIGMLITHELGHVIGAWISGGRVVSVSIPLFGFSQTIVHPNPHEHFVVWCGPIVGALLPVALLLLGQMRTWIGFFAGFCLIANGAYIGIGWIRRAGDAGDLLRLGTPIWAMIVFGIICIVAGLFCWHRTPALSIRGLASATDAAPINTDKCKVDDPRMNTNVHELNSNSCEFVSIRGSLDFLLGVHQCPIRG